MLLSLGVLCFLSLALSLPPAWFFSSWSSHYAFVWGCSCFVCLYSICNLVQMPVLVLSLEWTDFALSCFVFVLGFMVILFPTSRGAFANKAKTYDALRIVEKGKSGLMQCHGCFVHLSVPWSVPWSASPLRNIGGRILRCTSLAMLLRFSSLIIGDWKMGSEDFTLLWRKRSHRDSVLTVYFHCVLFVRDFRN